jgi:DNA-binding SARP family transcriptional activator/tetratricopeptide (TPR) repeat protein
VEESAELRLLGAVEAWHDGQRLDLGHARQRAVLAILLVEPSQAVSIEQLIQRIWDTEPPRSARNIIYGYVNRLKKTLSTCGDQFRLSRQAGGYLIDVDLEAVDLHRFRGLVKAARSAGDDAETVTLYRRALALWRGNVFEGTSSEWLDTVGQMLELEQLAALHDCHEAELRLGRHTQLLGELHQLAEAHPLDETVASHLMLASYRSGRQATALQCYQRLRSRLAEEFGVDPERRTQELHQRVLRRDPTLAVSATPDDPQPRAVPAQVPLDAYGFTGRHAELVRLDDLLATDATSARTSVVVVTGPAGVGKSALVMHWAHRAADRFPDGQIYLNLRGHDVHQHPVVSGDALGQVLRALGVLPSSIPVDQDERAALYRSVLAGRRMLMVFDDAMDAEQIEPLLPGRSGCQVVVTSRSRLVGLTSRYGATELALGVLTQAESFDLLRQVLGDQRVAGEPEAAAAIAQLCDHLPLALRVAAERMATQRGCTLGDVAAELAVEHRRLATLSMQDGSAAVRATYLGSYRALNAAAAQAFRRLSLHPGGEVGVPAAAVLLGTSQQATRRLLDSLSNLHLLDFVAPGRYRLQSLLHLYGLDCALTEDNDADRTNAITRLLDWYLRMAQNAGNLLMPQLSTLHDTSDELPLAFADRHEALEWFESECHNLAAATEQAARLDLSHAWRLPVAMCPFFLLRKRWHLWFATHDIGLVAARRMDNRVAEAQLLTSLGRAWWDVRQFGNAREAFQSATELLADVEDRWTEGMAFTGLAMVTREFRQFDQAIAHLRHALAIFTDIGDRWGNGHALKHLALVHQDRGRFDDATEALTEALWLCREIGDLCGEAHVLHHLGEGLLRQGRRDEATAYFQQALTIRRVIGDLQGEATTMERIGTLAVGNRGRTY